MAQFRSFTSQHSLHVIPEKQKNLTSKTWNKKLFNYLIKEMGLCKCPKRRVTNQFCFEHRVNVCEWCMVQKHPKVSYHINNNDFKSFVFLISMEFHVKLDFFFSALFKVTFNGFKIVIITQTALFVIRNFKMSLVFV